MGGRVGGHYSQTNQKSLTALSSRPCQNTVNFERVRKSVVAGVSAAALQMARARPAESGMH